MKVRIDGWQMTAVNTPMVRKERIVDADALAPKTVLVRVAGCGVCHTDLGFLYDAVPTRHTLPLTLGHEITGVVTHAGPGAERWLGKGVVIPAVMPCGDCDLCREGRGAICEAQIFPGNDDHGGFASHVKVPSTGLCEIDLAKLEASGLSLADLAVIADAVTTPYQAIRNSGLGQGDLAIFVGVGGVGIFGVQIARALGARVAALDVDPIRLERAASCGAEWTCTIVDPDSPRSIKKAIGTWAQAEGLPHNGWFIFETSGHPHGQALAFSLLNHGAHLGVVGYTSQKVNVRLSNLMAFDATARGTWGCAPSLYPEVVELVTSGRVEIAPFTERRPMSDINEVFGALHRGQMKNRPILIPDFEGEKS